jgi:competence CoiA-like predicted nuclease
MVKSKDNYTKNLKYFCPHCKEEVSFKIGTIREHHFSHKPNSTCSATAETILHFEAKHYLANQIANNLSFGIKKSLMCII